MDKKYVRLSKKMSLALRHNPDKFGIKLDKNGWANLDRFLKAMGMSREDLEYIQENSSKKRFEVFKSAWEERIRAYYGHSVEAKIEYKPAEPPEYLYHGTPPKVAQVILKEGIKPMGRQYAHHSTDVPTAENVGRRRHPKPAILTIRAREAHASGVRFYWGNEDIWLSDEIPSEFLMVHRR